MWHFVIWTIVVLARLVYLNSTNNGFELNCTVSRDTHPVDVGQLLKDNVNYSIIIPLAYTARVDITSLCCANITLQSFGSQCSSCFNQTKQCNLTDGYMELRVTTCKAEKSVNITCLSQKCATHNETYIPASKTVCENGYQNVCSKYGNWTTENCTTSDIDNDTNAITSVENEFNISTSQPNTSESSAYLLALRNSTTIATTSQPNTYESSVYLLALRNSTTIAADDNKNTSARVIMTTEGYNVTAYFATDASSEIHDNSAEAMNDLYTFLIVLGTVMVLVSVLVCIFFVRKRKDKLSITHVTYPLEYWHDQEYINNIMEKSSLPISSATNPVFTLDNTSSVTKRYKKKDDTANKSSRYSGMALRSSSAKGPDKANIKERTVSRNKADIPRNSVYDNVDKYEATVTDIYSLNNNQSKREKTTNIDEYASSGDWGAETNSPKVDVTSGAGPTKPPYNGKRAPRNKESNELEIEKWNESFDDDENLNVQAYENLYREQLRRSLEDWSAEESDV